MTQPIETKPSARQRILDAAAELFYANGMTATGIDAIVDRAGVARKSLYNNFESKDDLIRSYIEARHREWLDLYAARTISGRVDGDAAADVGMANVVAVFDAYLDHANLVYPSGFRGCGLLNAAAELPAQSAGRTAVRAHKEEVEGILRENLEAVVGPERAPLFAEQLSYLLEGAMARAGLDGKPDRLVQARQLAVSMLAVS